MNEKDNFTDVVENLSQQTTEQTDQTTPEEQQVVNSAEETITLGQENSPKIK